MLIRFITENFLSFNEEVEFSMIAGKGRNLAQHLIKAESRNDVNLLKTGIIYGANASGKSNLVKAIEFAKELITKGTDTNEPISIQRFKLNKENLSKPSKFEFEIKIDNHLYNYGFVCNPAFIEKEWLSQINKVSEKKIFERTTENQQVSVDFNFDFLKIQDEKERQFIEFVAKGTRPNQLFLTESQERNIQSTSLFKTIYKWFDESLYIIFPNSTYGGLALQLKENTQLLDVFCKFLNLFNTGVDDVEIQEQDIETLDLPTQVKKMIIKDLQKSDGETKGIVEIFKKRYLVYKNIDSEIIYSKITTKRLLNKSTESVSFEIEEESDGTQRLFDLIPALINLANQACVFIIDELDRSLHANLAAAFIQLFLKNSVDIPSQLIATTHESHLLDLDLLRRDEIWFVEKNKLGASKLYSLEEFQPRYDKEIRKDYLLGRYGAIPFIGNIEELNWLKTHKKHAEEKL